MKVEDVIRSEFVNDQTLIEIITNSAKKRGSWYQDHILNLLDLEVEQFTLDAKQNELNIWTVTQKEPWQSV